MTRSNPALDALRRAVTGRIESGDAVAIVEVPAPHVIESRMLNPIISLYRSAEFDGKRDTATADELFDAVNNLAWERAGSPALFPGDGADWAALETIAYRVITREWEREHAAESEEDYARACDAMHAANPHRFEGEL